MKTSKAQGKANRMVGFKPIPPKRTKGKAKPPKANSGKGRRFCIKGWTNVFYSWAGFEHGYVHTSRKEADSDSLRSGRIACVRVLIEGREGDGLKK
jgi:hypothetical protein